MKKALALSLSLLATSAFADLRLRDLVLGKKTSYSVSESCRKILSDNPDLFKDDALKATLVSMQDMKFDDKYFFHYTKTPQVPFILKSEVTDRNLAHQEIIVDGGYRDLVEYQMTYSNALGSASSAGLYLAANPFSSMTYGSFQVMFEINPQALVLNMTDGKVSNAFSAAQKRINSKSSVSSSCNTKLVESLIYDENGADIVYYSLAPNEWMVLLNEDMVEGSSVLTLNAGSKESVAEAMLVNGRFEPLRPYFDQSVKNRHYSFSADWIIQSVSSGRTEYVYALIDTSQSENLKSLLKGISQKDTKTFDRHINYMKAHGIDYQQVILSMGTSEFQKANANYLSTVSALILENPALIPDIQDLRLKLKHLISNKYLTLDLLLQAKIPFPAAMSLMEAGDIGITAQEKGTLAEYMFKNFPTDLKLLPEAKFIGLVEVYTKQSSDLELMKSFLRLVKLVKHESLSVFRSVSSQCKSELKPQLMNFYLTDLLAPEEVEPNFAGIKSFVKDHSLLLILIKGKTLNTSQKSGLVLSVWNSNKEATLKLLLGEKLLGVVSKTEAEAFDRFVYQSGDLELLDNYLSQAGSTILDLAEKGIAGSWGNLSESFASHLYGEIEKSPSSVKLLREGKGLVSLAYFLDRNYPEVHKKIVRDYPREIQPYIQSNYASLKPSYRSVVLTFAYFGKTFQSMPPAAQVAFLKAQSMSISREDQESYLRLLNLDAVLASELVSHFLTVKDVASLENILGTAPKVMAHAGSDILAKALRFLSTRNSKPLDLDGNFFGLLAPEKKVALLDLFLVLTDESSSLLVKEIKETFPSLRTSEKNTLAVFLGSKWSQIKYAQLEEELFAPLLLHLKETSGLGSWAASVNKMAKARFIPYMTGVLEAGLFNQIYQAQASAVTDEAFLDRVLLELPAAELGKVEKELRQSYPVLNAKYAFSFFEFLESSPKLERSKVIREHVENYLCKSIGNFQAIKQLIKDAPDKETKKNLKDLRDKHCP